MSQRVTETIGCNDGHVLTIQADRRCVRIEIDGHRRDLSPSAWRRLRGTVDSAITPQESPEAPSADSHRVTLMELVSHGSLSPGDVITYKQHPYTEAIITEDGNIDLDGETHDTPSAAAMAVAGGAARNGWDYWMLGGTPIAKIRERYRRS